MNTRTKKWIFGAAIVALGIIGALLLSKGQPQQLTGPIKLGFVGPLTGDAASFGKDEKNSLTIALEEINSNKNTKQPFSIVYEDGKCDGKDASTAARKLISLDQIKVILGGICSGETLAMAPIVEESHTILFSSFSTNPAISSAGDFVFRNIPADSYVAEGIAETVSKDGYKRIALLTENTDFALGVRDIVLKKASELGAIITANEVYSQGSKDFRSQVLKVKASRPDALVLNAQSGVTGGLSAKQTRELGISAPLYGSYVFNGDDAFKNGGVALNGMKLVDAPGLNKDNKKAQKFFTTYLARYGKPSNEFEIGARYDSLYILANAIEACKKVDTECIKNFLYSMPDYHGVIGTYHFDSNGDPVGLQTFTVKQIINVEKGEIKEIE